MEHTPAELGVKAKAAVCSIDRISAFVLRYGLVLVIFWIGCLKFTACESKGVFNHASHSPLLAWAYNILDVRNFSRGLGTVEIAIALLIAAGPVWPKLSIVGSLGGIGMFLTTLSFVITTPGVWQAGVWISRPCRISRPVSGQGCCVVGSGYLDPRRFSETRRC